MMKATLTIEKDAFNEVDVAMIDRVQKILTGIFGAQSVKRELEEEEPKRQ